MDIEIKMEDFSAEVLRQKSEAVFAALDDVGFHLEGEASDELENDPKRVDTGRLKGSITHKVDGNTVIVGTNVEYAIYVHEGTHRMTPNRFLKNAFERNEEQVRRYIINALEGD